MTPNAEWGLDGKVAIVTGGGAVGDGIGNGRAAAILLGQSGAHVLVVDRDLRALSRLADRYVILDKGQVARSGPVSDLSEQASTIERHIGVA